MIGDFIFIRTVKSINVDDELTIAYTNPYASFEERTETFQNWNSGNGFLCLCDVCSYLRGNTKVVNMQRNVHEAHNDAIEYCSLGYAMNESASTVMSFERMNRMIDDFDHLPIKGQGNVT